ncbi:hypothetical protein ACFVT1_34530 [Streptomyces sp. NPDC057963]|uniref:hypothetical protein n=1 Tax=Streptomyces sp. NPDC057963 TaxID=3346290 RepID=UPI0036E9D85D
MRTKALSAVFIHYEEPADLLLRAATADFTGPVDACSDGPLDVRYFAAQTGRQPVRRTIPSGGETSPFPFDRHDAMSRAHAKKPGFPFSRTTDWLPGVVAEALTTEP